MLCRRRSHKDVGEATKNTERNNGIILLFLFGTTKLSDCCNAKRRLSTLGAGLTSFLRFDFENRKTNPRDADTPPVQIWEDND